MIVDTSALIAILLDEPEAVEFSRRLLDCDDPPAMSTPTFVECAAVIDRRVGPAGRARFDRLTHLLRITLTPLTAEQAQFARAAYRRFGRGSGHPASLNLGDCFSYALAADTGRPLLFKGDDFIHTDITPAHRPTTGDR